MYNTVIAGTAIAQWSNQCKVPSLPLRLQSPRTLTLEWELWKEDDLDDLRLLDIGAKHLVINQRPIDRICCVSAKMELRVKPLVERDDENIDLDRQTDKKTDGLRGPFFIFWRTEPEHADETVVHKNLLYFYVLQKVDN